MANRIKTTLVKVVAGCLLVAILQIPILCIGQDFDGRITRSFTEPIEKSTVATAEAGVITQVPIKVGTYVRKGDTLAVLDDDVLIQSRLIAIARAESTARLDAAKSRMNMIQAQKETIEGLVEGGHVNRFEVDQKTAEYQSAVADYRERQDENKLNRLEVDRINTQLERRRIKSPFDGFVIKLHKQIGEHVSNTEPQYATVVRIDRLKVKFYLDEKTLQDLTPGKTVAVYLGQSKTKKIANVEFVSPIIDSDSSTGRVDVTIDNADHKIRSGTVCYWDSKQILIKAGHRK